MGTIKIGIAGGAGYTGGELLRILINHPQAEICWVHSHSNAGKPLADVHSDLFGDSDLKFTDSISQDIDVLFRLNTNAKHLGRSFVYGLPELNREAIKKAHNIANPGCFATCIQIGLLPLASVGLLTNEVHINATTGSTGAGQSLSPTSHFSWRNNNLSVYKAFEHQHLNEIGQSLNQLQNNFDQALNFIPQRGDFTRGIMASIYTETELSLDEAYDLYENYFKDHPFTHISKRNIDLKQVVNTNKALIHLEKHGNKLFIISTIDNLLKGASGHAVQNMNLMFGLGETVGLRLKAAAF